MVFGVHFLLHADWQRFIQGYVLDRSIEGYSECVRGIGRAGE